MPSQSLGEFQSLLGSVDQLIAIHGALQHGRGCRHEQDAIHRAGVVMTVAAWQAYIEKILAEALEAIGDDIRNPAGGVPAPNWAKHTYKMRCAALQSEIKKGADPDNSILGLSWDLCARADLATTNKIA